MALTVVFSALSDHCAALGRVLAHARWAVTEGKPAEGDPYLVSRLGDAILALIGEVKQAEAAADAARRATEYPVDVERARHALLECQRRFEAAAARIVSDLLSYEAIRDVVSARKGGPPWRRWSAEVRTALGLCQQPMDTARAALLACWQELAERAAGGVTVRTTAIGQVVAPDAPAGAGPTYPGADEAADDGRPHRGARAPVGSHGSG